MNITNRANNAAHSASDLSRGSVVKTKREAADAMAVNVTIKKIAHEDPVHQAIRAHFETLTDLNWKQKLNAKAIRRHAIRKFITDVVPNRDVRTVQPQLKTVVNWAIRIEHEAYQASNTLLKYHGILLRKARDVRARAMANKMQRLAREKFMAKSDDQVVPTMKEQSDSE